MLMNVSVISFINGTLAPYINTTLNATMDTTTLYNSTFINGTSLSTDAIVGLSVGLPVAVAGVAGAGIFIYKKIIPMIRARIPAPATA